jgi:hypothetical protein
MSKILVDPNLRAKLGQLYYPVELCDESGHVLGHFIPTVDMAQFEALGPEVSAEELQRRKQSGEKRYTTEELLEHLERL